MHQLGIESFYAADARRAWLVAMAVAKGGGIRFVSYRTTNGGRTWRSTALPIPSGLH
jgi:hypothetical protein